MSYAKELARLRPVSKDARLLAYLDANSDAEPGSMPYNLLTRALARIDRIAAQNADAVSPPNAQRLKPVDPNEDKKKIHVADNPYVDISKLPSELKEKYAAIKESAKLMHSLHEQLKAAKADNQREGIVRELKAIEEVNAAAWADIDEWASNNGAEKEITPEQKEDPVFMGMLRERNRRNLRQYINRDLKNIAAETDPERLKELNILLEKHRAEKDAIEKA